MEGIPFEYVVVNIEDYCPNIVQKVRSSYNKASVREDILGIELHKTILEVARQRGIQKVITGENGSRMASMMLSNIAKGRGSSLYYWGNAGCENGEITICRPLRDLLKKEVALYLHYNPVPILPKLPLTYNNILPGMGTYDLLFENFIDTLQDKFPATTYTMLRTATKIQRPQVVQECRNCGLVVDVVNCPLVA